MNTLTGTVTSIKMAKTVVVKVERKVAHPKYKKLIKKDNKFKAHTDKDLKVGDVVTIKPCKRISKGKYFEVV